MTALATLLVEATQRCVEVLGDEELCRRAVAVAVEAVANRHVYVRGQPTRITAWSANYEQIHFSASDRGVVLELTARGLPSIVIHVTRDKVTTEVIDENYIAMLNHRDESILQIVQKIIKKT